MNKKLIPYILLTIGFIAYIVLNPLIIGNDSYYYLNAICNETELTQEQHGFPLIFNILVVELPCNFVLIKILLLIMALTSLFIIQKFVELFAKTKEEKENVWFVMLSTIGLTPLLLQQFFKFEDDQFSYPFLYAFLYFSMKGQITKQIKYNLISIPFLVVSLSIWGGGLHYLVAMLLTPLNFILIILITLSKTDAFVLLFHTTFNIDTKILENQQYTAILLGGFFLWFGAFFIERMLIIPLIYLTIIALFNNKFAFLVIPFLLQGWNKASLKIKKLKPTYYKVLIGIAVVMFLVMTFLIINIPPTVQDFEVISWAKEQEFEKGIVNYWSIGYWVEHQGLKATAKGHYNPQDYNDSTAITSEELDCTLLKELKGSNLKVYDC